MLRLALWPLRFNQHRPTRYIPIVLCVFRQRRVCHMVKLVLQPVCLPWLAPVQKVISVPVDAGHRLSWHSSRRTLSFGRKSAGGGNRYPSGHDLLGSISFSYVLWQPVSMLCVHVEYHLLLVVLISYITFITALKTASFPFSLAMLQLSGVKWSNLWGLASFAAITKEDVMMYMVRWRHGVINSRQPILRYTVTNPENFMLVTNYEINYIFSVHISTSWKWLVVTCRMDSPGDGWVYRQIFRFCLHGMFQGRGSGGGIYPIHDCFQWSSVFVLAYWWRKCHLRGW